MAAPGESTAFAAAKAPARSRLRLSASSFLIVSYRLGAADVAHPVGLIGPHAGCPLVAHRYRHIVCVRAFAAEHAVLAEQPEVARLRDGLVGEGRDLVGGR
jgi:hypothetical protein